MSNNRESRRRSQRQNTRNGARPNHLRVAPPPQAPSAAATQENARRRLAQLAPAFEAMFGRVDRAATPPEQLAVLALDAPARGAYPALAGAIEPADPPARALEPGAAGCVAAADAECDGAAVRVMLVSRDRVASYMDGPAGRSIATAIAGVPRDPQARHVLVPLVLMVGGAGAFFVVGVPRDPPAVPEPAPPESDPTA
jgi:hypothetical protein